MIVAMKERSQRDFIAGINNDEPGIYRSIDKLFNSVAVPQFEILLQQFAKTSTSLINHSLSFFNVF